MRSALISLFAASAAWAAGTEAREAGLIVRFEHGEGPGPVRVAFRVTDARDGVPATGLRVRGWITPRPSAMVAAETACEQKIRSHLSGGLAQRAEGDLNAFQVVTLNRDRTLLFINPQVAFSRSKLERIVTLAGDPADWALSPDQERIAVSLPAESSIAFVDTRTARVERVVAVPGPGGGRPTRVLFAGGLLWTALDGGSEAIAIDPSTGTIARRVEVGSGLHQLAAAPDGRTVAVTSTDAGSVTLAGTEVRRFPAGSKPLSITHSAAAGSFYVAAAGDGGIHAVDADGATLAARREPGILHLRAEPGGRHVLALNSRTGEAAVLDTSDHSLRRVPLGGGEPDQAVFTRRYAYVRFAGSERIALLDRDDFRTGTARVTQLTAGRASPATDPAGIGPSDMIAALPDGDATVIANGPDKLLYFYREGLAAASGTIQNYSRSALGVLVIDRKLRETAPGLYETTADVSGGAYDVPFLIDQPRVTACFSASIAGRPAPAPEQTPRARFRMSAPVAVRDGAAVIRFEPIGAGPARVGLTVVEPPGVWQSRTTAVLRDGSYEALIRTPHAGYFQVMVEAPGEPRRLLGDFRVEASR